MEKFIPFHLEKGTSFLLKGEIYLFFNHKMTLFKNKCDISTYLAALRPEVGGGTDLARIIISSSVESYPLELSIKRKKENNGRDFD